MENNEEILVKKEKKKSKLWLIILINVLTVAIAAGGVYYYLEYIAKDEKEIEEKTPEVETEEVEEESVKMNISEVENYVYRYGNVSYPKNKEESVVPTELGIRKINLTVVQDLNLLYSPAPFSLEQYNNSLIKLYGEEFAETIEPANIQTFAAGEDIDYKYDPTTKMFTNVGGGYGGAGFPDFQRLEKINEVEYLDNKMIITVGVLICERGISNGYTSTPYACSNLDSDEIVKNDYDIVEYTVEDTKNNLYEKMTKFDYNYEYDEELDNYYLVSITKQ